MEKVMSYRQKDKNKLSDLNDLLKCKSQFPIIYQINYKVLDRDLKDLTYYSSACLYDSRFFYSSPQLILLQVHLTFALPNTPSTFFP